jgi:very-short-patch-repair endonuclease
MRISSLAAELGLARARALAQEQELVAGRRQLCAVGVPRWLVRRELRVGRWQRTGRQTVALHNGPLPVEAERWVAVLENGPRAALSGVTALQHDGITALTDDMIDVLVPQGAPRIRLPGVRRHESRRWREADLVATGIRRTKPAVSAVMAALWAVTERQATFFLILPVQQGLCSAAELAEALERVRRHRFRKALWLAVADIVDGARSIGELDIGRALERRGLPKPSRQVRRRRDDGSVYLDLAWDDYGLTMEIDGVQHDLPWMRLADTVRDLGSLAEGADVMRIPLLAWRLDEERVLDAIESVFRSRGWLPAAA